MHNGLTVASIQLTDVNPGDGGLSLIPGSHKSNYPCPQDMRLYQKHREHIRQVTCRAGDAIIFTEAVTHGTLPWTAGPSPPVNSHPLHRWQHGVCTRL